MGKDHIIVRDPLNVLNDGSSIYVGRKRSVFDKYKDKSGLYIGKVIESQSVGTNWYNKPVLLDSMSPHAIFICGMRGSGKSYTLGVIAEEMATKNKGAGVIVIDPMGIFWSMKQKNKIAQEKSFLRRWGLSAKGFDNVCVFLPEGHANDAPSDTFDRVFSIRPSEVSIDEWCLTFNIDRFETMGLLLERVIDRVRRGYMTVDEIEVESKGDDYDLADLIDCINLEDSINSNERGFKQTTRRALLARLNGADKWGIFSKEGTQLKDLSRRGIVSVVDVSFLDDNVRALVVGILARNLLNTRKVISRHEATGNLKNIFGAIPATWLMIDEAHILVPASGQKTAATDPIIEYVRQGRQPGCSLVLATQQPAAIDSRVLSQTDILFCHKLVYDDDIKAVTRRMPAEMPAKFKDGHFIKNLPIGVAIVGDKEEQSSRSFLAQIRPRISQHEGRERTSSIDLDPDIVRENLKELLAERYADSEPDELGELVSSIEQEYDVSFNVDELLNELAHEGAIDREVTELPLDDSDLGERHVEPSEHDAPLAPPLEPVPPSEHDTPADAADSGGAISEEPASNADDTSLVEFPIDHELHVDIEPADTTYAQEPLVPPGSFTEEDRYRRDVNYEKVIIVPERIDADDISSMAKTHKKRRLIGKPDEISSMYMVFYPLWKVMVDVFPKNESYVSLALYVDAITNELVINDRKTTRTRGIRDLVSLPADGRSFLRYLIKRENPTYEEISRERDITRKKTESKVASLIDRELVKLKKVGDSYEVRPADHFFLIESPLDKRLKNVQFDVVEDYVETDAIVEPVVQKKDAHAAVELFLDVRVWDQHIVYYPYWVVTYENGSSVRTEIFDAVTGKRDADVGNMLRGRL
ncbi:MAG TPA: ATP-binding protein [Methanomicrobia archaeon]|nr:ATP-binding protein [Methanomicrobia archaeon]